MSEDYHIAVFKAVDWGDFTGVAYMPGLEKAAGVKKDYSIDECIGMGKSTMKSNEMPTFYRINDSLVFFHPQLKGPLLFICAEDDKKVPEVMGVIRGNIEELFTSDPSLDYCTEPGKKKPLREKGYRHPDFKRVDKPDSKAQRFVKFLRALCKGKNIDTQFIHASDLEAIFARNYSKFDKGEKFLRAFETTFQHKEIVARNYLAFRTLKE